MAHSAARLELDCLVASGNPVTLASLDGVLNGKGFSVTGLAASALEVLLALRRRPVTVVLVDFELPDLGGLEVTRRAAEIARSQTAVILRTSDSDLRLVSALDAGARAVVLDDSPPETLLEAIAQVSAGCIYVDPRLHV